MYFWENNYIDQKSKHTIFKFKFCYSDNMKNKQCNFVLIAELKSSYYTRQTKVFNYLTIVSSIWLYN